ncbi:hypothetical protein EVG20_g8909 [Dentipellis fragilis]|uniref:Uncharacterized protein n=1 Tax=Dentipellis fragilis TaxID=205917 RepID=A0A4Y9Y3Y0_9AGAM|nr:hypothetical protein EVG20_g8909 [Dentipellis fragilis]
MILLPERSPPAQILPLQGAQSTHPPSRRRDLSRNHDFSTSHSGEQGHSTFAAWECKRTHEKLRALTAAAFGRFHRQVPPITLPTRSCLPLPWLKTHLHIITARRPHPPSPGPSPSVDQLKLSDAFPSESSGTASLGRLYQGTVDTISQTPAQLRQETLTSSSPQSPLTAIPSDRGSPLASNAEDGIPSLDMSSNPVCLDISPETGDDSGSRYSFRARKAQQLNPYAFDKILYQRQMKSNPEAIVTTVGHTIIRYLSDGESTGDDSQAIDKIRSPTPTSESDKLNTTNAPTLRKRRRMTPKPRLATRTARDGEDRPITVTRWYPDVFQSHSSDEDSNAAILATRRSVRKQPISEKVSLKGKDQEHVAASPSNVSSNGSLEIYDETLSHLAESYLAESSESDAQEHRASASSHIPFRGRSPVQAAWTSRSGARLVLKPVAQTSRRRRPTHVKHKDSARAARLRKMQTRDHKSDKDVGYALRRSSSKQGGLSVLRSANGYVTGRLHKRQATTIDMEDEALQKALVPTPVLPLPQSFMDTSELMSSMTSSSDDGRSADHIPKRMDPANHIVVDSGVKAVPSGFDFTPDSYLRKGWLRELLLTISGSGQHDAWHEDEFYGHRLPRNPSIDDISTYLRAITTAIHDVFTTLPMRRKDVSQACTTMHFICQMISSFSTQVTGREHTELIRLVLDCTDTLLATFDTRQDLSTSSSITSDSRVIHIYWFSLEIVVRLYCNRPLTLIEELSKCIKLRSLSVIRRLLQFGMKSIVEAMHQTSPVDCYSAQGSAMQAWICILHLCNARHSSGCRLPFTTVWELIQKTSTSRQISSRPLTDSEDIWLVVFSINALSHLSVHGHLTSTSCVPTSWGIIAFALNRVRLTSHADLDMMLDRSTIVKRDSYIRVVIQRCLLLHQRWHWTFDGIMATLSRIADIFKSRKFSNLTGESSDFPAFMKHSDRDLLFNPVAEDNAFTLFLKLFAKSMECIEPKTEPEYSNKVRRHLSIIVPVGSICFDEHGRSIDSDLSVLYNRFGVIAAAIYIHPLPSSAQHYLALAHHYIKFSEASRTTRSICISGLMYLGIQMQLLNFPLDEILSWSTQITSCLLHEYQLISVSEEQLANGTFFETPTTQCFGLLLQSLCHLVTLAPVQDSFHKLHVGFLEGIWISSALAIPSLLHKPDVASSVKHIIHAYLQNCRNNQDAIKIRQESQDDYGQFELDMDDPELSAALGDSTQIQLLDDTQQHTDIILNTTGQCIMVPPVPQLWLLFCLLYKYPVSLTLFALLSKSCPILCQFLMASLREDVTALARCPDIYASLTLDDLACFIHYAQRVKCEITLNMNGHIDEPPIALPLYIFEFLCNVQGFDGMIMSHCWSVLKGHIWDSDGLPDVLGDEATRFHAIGCRGDRSSEWISSDMFYLPVLQCMQCDALLKNLSCFPIVFFTRDGARPGYTTSMSYCKIHYHPNYYIQDSVRCYYRGIPDAFQLEEHAFITVKLYEGNQESWLKFAMVWRNLQMIDEGQPVKMHTWDMCEKFIERMGYKGLLSLHAVVTDGITIGHPCCAVHNCMWPLINNRHHYCSVHKSDTLKCVITACEACAKQGHRTCSKLDHHWVEEIWNEHGKAFFQLQQHLKKAHPSYLPDANSDPNGLTDDSGDDNDNEDMQHGAKSDKGNRKLQSHFGHRRTHNEQLIVCCCDMTRGVGRHSAAVLIQL